MDAPPTENEEEQLTLQPVLMDTTTISEGSSPQKVDMPSSSPCNTTECRPSPTHRGLGEPDGSLLYQCAGEDKCMRANYTETHSASDCLSFSLYCLSVSLYCLSVSISVSVSLTLRLSVFLLVSAVLFVSVCLSAFLSLPLSL